MQNILREQSQYPWLLMPWLLVSWHQQPWYRIYRINRCSSSTTKDFNYCQTSYIKHHIPRPKGFSSGLAAYFAQPIEAHWGRDKMDAISQTTLSNTFSWMKMLEFRLKFHWELFPRDHLAIFLLGADQATSHYLNQWWLDYRRIYIYMYELIWEWKCSWSSADRRCSNNLWVVNNVIA